MDFNPEVKFRTQLRMAFGKTLSKAIINPEVLDYIKDESITTDIQGYKEILFGIHVDKEVYNGKTLRAYIHESMDDEVKGLFSGNLVDTLLSFDPLITIKIPDIFSDVDWGKDGVVPLVYVQTSIPLKGYDEYIAYHGSGYQELISSDSKPPYFCISVKYSEDYILLNQRVQINEKNISLYEFFPQISRSDWLELEETVLAHSPEAPGVPGYYYCLKKDIYRAHRSLNKENLDLIEDDQNCNEECKRDCRNPENIKTVLKNYVLNVGTPVVQRDRSRMFLETYNVSFIMFYHKDENNINSRLGVHGNRIADIVEQVIGEYKVKLEDRCYDGIGDITLPVIHGSKSFDFSGASLTFDDVVIFDGWSESRRDSSYGINVYYSEYGDLVNSQDYHYYLQSSVTLNPTFMIPLGARTIYYCDEPSHSYTLGDSYMTVSY